MLRSSTDERRSFALSSLGRIGTRAAPAALLIGLCLFAACSGGDSGKGADGGGGAASGSSGPSGGVGPGTSSGGSSARGGGTGTSTAAGGGGAHAGGASAAGGAHAGGGTSTGSSAGASANGGAGGASASATAQASSSTAASSSSAASSSVSASSSSAASSSSSSSSSGSGGGVDSQCAAAEEWYNCDASNPCTCMGFTCVVDPILGPSGYSTGSNYCERSCQTDADCPFFGSSCNSGYCGARSCDKSSIDCTADGVAGTCVQWTNPWQTAGSAVNYGVCFKAGTTPAFGVCSPDVASCVQGTVCVRLDDANSGTCQPLCLRSGNSGPICAQTGNACIVPEVKHMPDITFVCGD